MRLLDIMTETSLQNNRAPILILGDVFHSRRPSLELGLEVQNRLEYAWGRGVLYFLLRGNHDVQDPLQEQCVLNIFRKVAVPITRPRSAIQNGVLLCFMPWYPPAVFCEGIQLLAKEALNHRGPRFLFSHVSLQEGNVSPSNGKIDTPIRAGDLCPSVWNSIYLGDYHAAQKVDGQEIYYLGAPRPQTFGDFDNIGIWRLDIYETTHTCTPVPLHSYFPAYKSWRVEFDSDLPLSGYSPHDRNRVYTTLELTVRVRTLYPDAAVLPIQKDSIPGSERIKASDNINTQQIVERWVRWKNLPETPYLNEAIRIMGGKRV